MYAHTCLWHSERDKINIYDIINYISIYIQFFQLRVKLNTGSRTCLFFSWVSIFDTNNNSDRNIYISEISSFTSYLVGDGEKIACSSLDQKLLLMLWLQLHAVLLYQPHFQWTKSQHQRYFIKNGLNYDDYIFGILSVSNIWMKL